MPDAADLLPDADEVADRRPVCCPFCGHDGAFDGLGDTPDLFAFTRAGQTSAAFEVLWYGSRCPSCNGQFRMLEEARDA